MWRLESRLDDWRDPVRLYRSSLEATPKSPTLRIDLASVLLDNRVAAENEDDYARAETDFRDAMRYAPDDIAPLNDLGLLLFRQGRRGEGIACVQRTMTLRPESPDPYFNMGILLHGSDDDSRALDYYVKALKLRPSDPVVFAEVRKLHLH